MLTQRMIEVLRCPVCRGLLSREEAALVCELRHSFDIARQGYVNLGTGRKLPEGDTAAMVQARESFLATGLYAPLTTALSKVLPCKGLIVDLGGGTGHYLAATSREGLVLDVSKAALKKAARRVGAVLADTWGDLPIGDGQVQAVLNVFAPRNGPEIHRILAKGGVLIVVTPAADHLLALRQELGLLEIDESKADRLKATLKDFDNESRTELSWPMELTEQQARDLIMMGPNAFHTQNPRVRAMTVTASVVLTTWRGRLLPSHQADRDTGR